MDGEAAALRSSSLDLSRSVALYIQLYDLPPLSLVPGRLRLPGIVFPVANLTLHSETDPDPFVYRARISMLGDVDIRTTADLSGINGLILIHPWITLLLDQDFSGGVPQFDLAARALRLLVRLKQPFGALFLAPVAREQFRRVATDALITVRLGKDVSLTELMDCVRTVDVQ